jgi:2,5-diamino-6-(ribosylamino)-4(3H)-pyrimidinone 5'-phosphate reductase
MSIDGKISTGLGERDIDADSKYVDSLKNGRYQYEQLEQETDLASFNTGKTMVKIGWNDSKDGITKIPVDFIILDNEPHLTLLGVKNLLSHVKKLYIVTTNKEHPACEMEEGNLEVILYEGGVGFKDLFTKLRSKGIERVTIQSGGTMNAELIRYGLVDELSLTVAPIMIGGKDTSTLEDGDSLSSIDELGMISEFEIIEIKVLDKSFVHMRYKKKEK